MLVHIITKCNGDIRSAVSGRTPQEGVISAMVQDQYTFFFSFFLLFSLRKQSNFQSQIIQYSFFI